MRAAMRIFVAMLAGALLLLVAILIVPQPTEPQPTVLFLFSLTSLYAVAILAFVIFLGILLVANRSYEGPEPDFISDGTVNGLMEEKRSGTLLRRSLRIRHSAAKTGHHTPDTHQSIQARPTARPEQALDRLLRLKRLGIWNPQTDSSAD
jgi:hypothetical protein